MSEDPLAAEREQRRREREARRHRREEQGGGDAPVAAPPPPQRPVPPDSPAGALAPKQTHPHRRRLGAAALLVAVFAGTAVLAALVYRHFHRDSAPPPAPPLRTVSVTIPEGYSRPQTAALAREDGLRGSYMAASRGHEGFLFPDTFELERHAKAADLVRLQLEDFKRRIAGVDLAYARSKNLTLHDVVTIASMIEHEAVSEGDRRKVAAVVYNRLREGMPLGIDATIRFANDNYTRPLTESELAIDSPYNTRTHTGLPPGPIDSPGLASLEAAAHPAKGDYLFYVVQPGACNKLAFSSTEAEFEEDVARYDEAREAAGGNSPTTCGE